MAALENKMAGLPPKFAVKNWARPSRSRICRHHGLPLASEPATTESPKHASLMGAACALCAAARHAKRIERRFMVTASLRLTSSESLL